MAGGWQRRPQLLLVPAFVPEEREENEAIAEISRSRGISRGAANTEKKAHACEDSMTWRPPHPIPELEYHIDRGVLILK
jgi:hypothetical protein